MCVKLKRVHLKVKVEADLEMPEFCMYGPIHTQLHGQRVGALWPEVFEHKLGPIAG